MIKILFNRSNKANLPEIDAYIRYFNNTNNFKAYDSSEFKNKIDYDYFDVLWEFKGIGGLKSNSNQLLIHEYASLSTGKTSNLKNLLKSKLNPKPDLRIFLNDIVRAGFNFNDDVDYHYRDMGIDDSFISQPLVEKVFDFIYVGSISREREIDKLLKAFTEKDNGILCLVGEVEDKIYNKYKNYKNLIFTGKVAYSEVPQIASKAEYGINFIPDKYPYNIQTSTKLLEYLALGLKIISTDYDWVKEIEQIHDSSFYKLNYTNLSFDKAKIDNHVFSTSFKANDYLWSRVIEDSGISKSIIDKLQ